MTTIRQFPYARCECLTRGNVTFRTRIGFAAWFRTAPRFHCAHEVFVRVLRQNTKLHSCFEALAVTTPTF